MPYSDEQLQLNDFLKRVKDLPKDKSKMVYLIVLDNMSMLNLAFGHQDTNIHIGKLCRKIIEDLEDECDLFRIQSDQIALILNADSAQEVIRLDQNLKNTIRQFGGIDEKLKLHFSSKTSYSILRKDNAEEILNNVYTKALNGLSRNDLESAFDNSGIGGRDKSLLEMNLANQIEKAISENRLKFAYQPIIDAKTGEVSHYECLLRLLNEQGELESAGTFIPIAERMGFIDIIDILTLKMAIAELKKNPTLKLALNISNLTIGNADWIKTFYDNIDEDAAIRLIIEITETAASRNLGETALFIANLQEAGCQVALDDFGSGYTSFRQIGALSIDMVKFDGMLINGIENNHNNQLLVRSLLSFLNGLGLKTVAEFVNNGAAAKILMEYGIDYMQGHYFGEAVAEITEPPKSLI